MQLYTPDFLLALSKNYFEKSYKASTDLFQDNYASDKDIFWKISFPAVNMSFSLELAFKGILLHEGVSKVYKHELLLLFNKISVEVQDKIIEYQETKEFESGLPNVILSGQLQDEIKKPIRGSYGSVRERTFDILKRHQNSFVNFRYLHEFGSKSINDDFDFSFNYFSNLTYASINIFSELLGKAIKPF